MREQQEKHEGMIPAISLWQPWAQWVALGWKPIETRTHRRFLPLLGKEICIHAARKWDMKALSIAKKYLTEHQVNQTILMDELEPSIVGTARVYYMGELDEHDSQYALCDCSVPGLWGLYLSAIKKFEKPIPCKGHQGIFYVSKEVIR